MVKSNKNRIDNFKDLNEKSKVRYANQIKRLEKHNLTLTKVKKLNNIEMAKALNYGGKPENLDKTMNAYRKNFSAISLIPNRRTETVNYEIVSREGIEKGSEQYTIRKRELIKVAGAKFWALVDRLSEISKENLNVKFDDYNYIDEHGKTHKTNEIFDYAREFLAKGKTIVDIINKIDAKYSDDLESLLPSVYDEKLELEQWEFDLALEFDS